MNDLELAFHQAMIDTHKVAQRACDYTASYFLRMVTESEAWRLPGGSWPPTNRQTVSPRCGCAVGWT
jgi:hypothetical protein